MNVENKINKIAKILKEKGFIVYKKGGKEPGVFYAKEGDSRIGFVYPTNTKRIYIRQDKDVVFFKDI